MRTCGNATLLAESEFPAGRPRLPLAKETVTRRQAFVIRCPSCVAKEKLLPFHDTFWHLSKFRSLYY
jgi:hypothetical protein